MYLVKTLNGKENLIATILKKHNIEVKPGSEKGFLLAQTKPSEELIYDLRGYIIGIIEIDEEKARFLTHPLKPEEERIKPGNSVEITSGVFQGFKGIVRTITEEKLTVDINLFGQATALEVQVDEVKPLKFNLL